MSPALAADIVLIAAATLYALATVLYLSQLMGRPGRGGRIAMTTATLLHGLHFFAVSAIVRACPVTGIHTATSLMALMTSVGFLVAARRPRVEVVGAFVAPLALMAVLAARFVGASGRGIEVTKTLHGVVLPLHVTSILVASAFFAVASAISATYLVQERQLKAKRSIALLSKLPSLDTLDRLAARFLVAGFPLLTLGVATGLLWIGNAKMGSSQWFRQGVGLLAWVQLAVVLFMRGAGGWRGRRAAYGTIAGFLCAMLVFGLYLLHSTGVTQ
ncbi:MAG: cytochrome c biogenesis protein CcsA [Polyangiales bacterium]